MGSFVNRENMLLGYIPQKSISSSSNSLDVDFHDVFGGPPRRSSVQDWRHSNSNEDVESSTSCKDEEREQEVEERVFDEKKERVYSRDPWTGLIEKPVFGEENSMRNRGKYRNDDFFDDIFRGDESSSSTLRKPSRDLHSSSSHVSSLSRSLSFQSESFRGGSSLPLMLSLPVKSTSETDSSAFAAQGHNLRKNKETAIIGFPSSPGASTSRFSIEVTQRQEGLKNELQSPYRQSSLSKEVSLRSKGLEQASKSVKHDSEDYCKEDSSTSEITYNSTQFHFSIYKWASAGVPMAMSLREDNKSSTKESSKSDDTVNQHAASSLQGVEQSSDNYDMLAENKPLRIPQKNQDDNSVPSTKSIFVDSEITKEVIPAKGEQKSLMNIQNILKKVPGNLLSQNAKKDIKTGSDPSTVDLSSFKGSEKRIPVSKKEALESEEPLYCLLTDMKAGSGKHGADSSSARETEKQMPVSKTEISKPESLYCLLKDDKHDLGASGGDKKIFGSNGKRIRNSKKETPKSEEPLYCLLKDDCQGNDEAIDKAGTKKVAVSSIYTSAGDVGKKKKVKKQSGKRNIFSPTEENSSSLLDTPLEEKPVVNKAEGMVKNFVNTFNQNVPSKPLRNVAIREQADTVTVVAADKAEGQQNIKFDQKKNVILTDSTPGRVDQSSKQFAKLHREIKTVDQVLDCAFERNKSSASCAEPVIETIAIAVDNVEDTSEEFDCTVKELSQDQNKDPQVGQSHEEIQASDAKIRKWANGKEGNIRSLLSTLQYVLWPESGWKPVPLVDIIEGGSVRRSYQKALLCLHPDKLQQKGALPHQKYIAAKVFDILQEAWEHFNSLGSF